MSRNCFICGKDLSILDPCAKTQDGKYLCQDDVEKIFSDKATNWSGIKLTASTWISKHTSTGIKEFIDGPNKVKLLEAKGTGLINCFVCNKKIGLMNDKATTKDGKPICFNDVNLLFNTSSATKYAIPSKLKRKVKAMDSTVITQALNDGLEGKLYCPHCGSTNIQPLGSHRKGFSVGKAVGGAVLTGGIGALAGFAGKKTKQTDFVCMDCGKQFKN